MKSRQSQEKYTANYCEENIWQLAKQIESPCYVVFISNPNRQMAIWQQQAAPETQALIWDYHVILFEQKNGHWLCHDLDSRLPRALNVGEYLRASFPNQVSVNPQFHPRFKLIDKQNYLHSFASDRSHMKQNDEWLSPPPSWPCIGIEKNQTDNLQQFIDSNDDTFGHCYSLDELLATLDSKTL